MGAMTQEQINIDLFDEVTRLQKENIELRKQLKNIKPKNVEKFKELLREYSIKMKFGLEGFEDKEQELIQMYSELEEPNEKPVIEAKEE